MNFLDIKLPSVKSMGGAFIALSLMDVRSIESVAGALQFPCNDDLSSQLLFRNVSYGEKTARPKCTVIAEGNHEEETVYHQLLHHVIAQTRNSSVSVFTEGEAPDRSQNPTEIYKLGSKVVRHSFLDSFVFTEQSLPKLFRKQPLLMDEHQFYKSLSGKLEGEVKKALNEFVKFHITKRGKGQIRVMETAGDKAIVKIGCAHLVDAEQNPFFIYLKNKFDLTFIYSPQPDCIPGQSLSNMLKIDMWEIYFQSLVRNLVPGDNQENPRIFSQLEAKAEAVKPLMPDDDHRLLLDAAVNYVKLSDIYKYDTGLKPDERQQAIENEFVKLLNLPDDMQNNQRFFQFFVNHIRSLTDNDQTLSFFKELTKEQKIKLLHVLNKAACFYDSPIFTVYVRGGYQANKQHAIHAVDTVKQYLQDQGIIKEDL